MPIRPSIFASCYIAAQFLTWKLRQCLSPAPARRSTYEQHVQYTREKHYNIRHSYHNDNDNDNDVNTYNNHNYNYNHYK